MDSGYYAAFSGVVARNQALDTAANNLANTNTNGFRASREFFRQTLTGPDAVHSQLNTVVNNFGVLGGNQLDLRQGQMAFTGNPLDLAIEGHGFFAIQTAAGVRYTRDGSLQLSTQGVLVTAAQEPVLDLRGRRILIPPGEVSIGADGTISVGGAAAGQVALYDFSPAVQLEAEGVDRYKAPEKTAVKATGATLHQGMVESSNQDVVQGTLQLVLVQRQAEMMQKALSLFNSDFDKPASEELPKV